MKKESREKLKSRLLEIMIGHIGRSKAIGMGELYEQVFGRPYNNRINDTRRLRSLITELRKDGKGICSASTKEGSGYWIASADSELRDYCSKLRKKAFKILRMESNIMAISMPELMGQMELELNWEQTKE